MVNRFDSDVLPSEKRERVVGSPKQGRPGYRGRRERGIREGRNAGVRARPRPNPLLGRRRSNNTFGGTEIAWCSGRLRPSSSGRETNNG